MKICCLLSPHSNGGNRRFSGSPGAAPGSAEWPGAGRILDRSFVPVSVVKSLSQPSGPWRSLRQGPNSYSSDPLRGSCGRLAHPDTVLRYGVPVKRTVKVRPR